MSAAPTTNAFAFRAFPSIESSHRTHLISELRSVGLSDDDVEWVATEKVHGCNFSLITDGKQVRAAKRNSMLESTSSFYNFHKIVAELTPSLMHLFQLAADEKGDVATLRRTCMENDAKTAAVIADSAAVPSAPSASSSSSAAASSPTHPNSLPPLTGLTIYGEIYGGIYPHTAVPQMNVKRVQNGVYYSNTVHFIAFDILIHGFGFLPFHLFTSLCASARPIAIPVTPLIHRGTLADCLNKIDVEHMPTRVPSAIHNLPNIDNNLAEGVVIKIADVRHFQATFESEQRICLKLKRSSFKEEEGGGEDAEQLKKKQGEEKEKKKTAIATTPMGQVVAALSGFINDNRLHNLLSKMEDDVGDKTKASGSPAEYLLKVLAQPLIDDAMTDFAKLSDLNAVYVALPEKEKKIVALRLTAVAGALLKSRQEEIVNGTY